VERAVLEHLGSPAYLPFTIAAGVMLGFTALELIFALLGKPLSALLDKAFGDHAAPDAHAPDAHPEPAAPSKIAEAFAWLNAGRVPGLVLLILILAGFAAFGMVIQGMADSVWTTLPAILAALGSAALTVPATRFASRVLGRLLPRDETYALTHAELVGLTGVVTLGPVKAGVVAKARFKDLHGNLHFPRIEPYTPGETIEAGAMVLAVESRGPIIAVARAAPSLTGRAA
jgi:hypothetical protein